MSHPTPPNPPNLPTGGEPAFDDFCDPFFDRPVYLTVNRTPGRVEGDADAWTATLVFDASDPLPDGAVATGLSEVWALEALLGQVQQQYYARNITRSEAQAALTEIRIHLAGGDDSDDVMSDDVMLA